MRWRNRLVLWPSHDFRLVQDLCLRERADFVAGNQRALFPGSTDLKPGDNSYRLCMRSAEEML